MRRTLFQMQTAFVAVLFCTSLSAMAADLPGTGLIGVIKSANGKPLEGVAVSARSQNKTFTTSVYTNQNGEYFFPALDAGQYAIWAQAVGFETARSEQPISPGKKIQQNFTLKPLQEFEKQLSSTEWSQSLPEGTPQDAWMKRVLTANCSNCHLKGFILANRFDAKGWDTVVKAMIEKQIPANAPNRKILDLYQHDLVEYLTKIRGPQPYPWKLKLLPRLSGEETQVVVTEYDVPRGETPTYIMAHNGSDWIEGIASKSEGAAFHDAVVNAKDGAVYFSDPETAGRTVGKLDPRTGRITNYMLEDKDGKAVSTHGAVADPQGNIWLTNGTEGTILKFDPVSEKFQRFPRGKPASEQSGEASGEGGGKIGPTVTIDSKGNLWATQPTGVLKLNPATGEYTDYKSVTKGGEPYGIAIDSEDNVWFSQLQGDRVGYVNAKTAEVGEIVLTKMDEELRAAKEHPEVPNLHFIFQKGPRRMGADPKGNSVWIAQFWAGRFMKIDIHTKKVTEYKMPWEHSEPYDMVVDKNHMVWISMMNSDRVTRFNPSTEKFTDFAVPTLGTEARFLEVDNSTDPPTVWLPEYRTNKLARIQFRAGATAQGVKQRAKNSQEQ
jgi:streptogramin lyase